MESNIENSKNDIMISDKEIVERILNGEKNLYELIMRRNNQLLYRVIRSYLTVESEIDDAMQNAYIQAYIKLDKFRGDSSISTWLVRIGINESLRRLRELAKERNHVDIVDIRENINQSHYYMNPEKKAVQNEKRQAIEKAIDKLPEKYRIVFMMREIDGMEVREVAESLDISVENVKVRTHRAKALLREALQNVEITEDVFSYGSHHCDLMVHNVMNKINQLGNVWDGTKEG